MPSYTLDRKGVRSTYYAPAGSMKSGGVRVYGEKEMERLFKVLPDDALTYRAVMFTLKKAARPLVQKMKQLAPVSTKQAFRTVHRHYAKGAFMSKIKIHKPGELKRSIGIVTGRKKRFKPPWISVGPRFGNKAVGQNDAWYFHFVELGTSKIRPRPFLRPAFDATKSTIERTLTHDFEKILLEYIDKHAPKYY